MKKSSLFAVTAIALASLSLAGCGHKNAAAEKAVTANVKAYINDYATQKFSALMPIISGDALTSLQNNMQTLQNMNVQNEVKNVKVSHIDFPDSDHAMAEGTYLLSQTIPKYGTSVDQYTVEYYLRVIDGEWKIYATQTEIDAPNVGSNK